MARQLRALGFDARSLAGGYTAWSRAFAVEPTVGGAVATPAAEQARQTWTDHPLWQRVGQAARAVGRPFAQWRREE